MNTSNYIQVEDFEGGQDSKFINEFLKPYFKDVFKDLAQRCTQASPEKKLDRVTFIEYSNLPGMISDRFFKIFDTNDDDQITEKSFIQNFISVFHSNLATRMRITFDMYDFDGDGNISQEDVRIVLSYIPFKRSFNVEASQMRSRFSSKQSPTKDVSLKPNKVGIREGLYEFDEGKNLNYKDRIQEQEEIKTFITQVFQDQQEMSYDDYSTFNNEVSSEMFFSIMAVLHERLPCSGNFFRLKKIYNTKINGITTVRNNSQSTSIASPNILKTIHVMTHSTENLQKKCMSPIIVNNKKILLASNNKFDEKTSSSRKSSSGISQFSIDDDEQKSNTQDNDVLRTCGTPKLSKFKKTGVLKKQDSEGANAMLPIESTTTNFMSQRLNRVSSPATPNMKNVVRMNINDKNTSISSFLEPIKANSNQHIANSPSNNNKQLVAKTKSTFSKVKVKAVVPNSVQQFNTFESSCQSAKINTNHFNEEEEFVLENFGPDKKENSIYHESECLFLTRTGRYKKYWAVLLGNEIYCYKSQNEGTHKIMHCLVGTFIKVLPEEFDETTKETMWPIKIIMPPNKFRIFYFRQKEQQMKWENMIKEAIGYSNIFDFYQLEIKILGQGQFGQVKLATHLFNGQQVAIKTVKKKDMKQMEIFQQRREIEVLKMCQHPNIIQLIDLFENQEYYYIVLEYMQGKDFFDYLASRKFKISEMRARELILQIANAIQYLHSYGIVHRDLKLENIMMNNDSDQAIPKLVDFGLAKIIGPNEKSDEPFGTLGYAAPEVLKKDPYSFSCDIWSLGCISYAILSGSLPFDHQDSQEALRRTLEEPLEFDVPQWSKISESAQDFITGLLIKNPSKRFTLEQALSHPWLRKYSIK